MALMALKVFVQREGKSPNFIICDIFYGSYVMLLCAFKCSGLYMLKYKQKKGFQISRMFSFLFQRNHFLMLNNICATVVV